jgi:hypothetical protein
MFVPLTAVRIQSDGAHDRGKPGQVVPEGRSQKTASILSGFFARYLQA